MPPVVLIKPFEVPEGQDEAFLAAWEAAKAFMARQPGAIATGSTGALDLMPSTTQSSLRRGRSLSPIGAVLVFAAYGGRPVPPGERLWRGAHATRPAPV